MKKKNKKINRLMAAGLREIEQRRLENVKEHAAAKERDDSLLANEQRQDQQINELIGENADTRSRVGTFVDNHLPGVIRAEIAAHAAGTQGPSDPAPTAPLPQREIEMGEASHQAPRPPRTPRNNQGPPRDPLRPPRKSMAPQEAILPTVMTLATPAWKV